MRSDYVKLQKIFSNNVTFYRKKCNLTQEKLAEITGLHQTYISDLERGIRNPSLTTISKIANALDIDAEKLLKRGKNSGI